MQFIDLKAQYDALKADVDARIQSVLDHGQFIMGPEVLEMETALARIAGAGYCISVASGTEALLISLMALGIGRGDEVITTAFTFAATAEVVLRVGATPVFVDVERDTVNIDAALVEAAITPRTRAIMPVGLYGQPSDMAVLGEIAARRRLALIDDAAQSFGSTFEGRPTGSLGTLSCTSFFPSKPLGCYGDGGAIFTDDEGLATVCSEIRVHGQSRRYYHARLGVGGRMDTLQCAIVLAKLKRFEWEIDRRLAIGARYNDLLDQAGIARILQRPGRTSVFAQYTVLVEEREQVATAMKIAGIPTAVHYPMPLHRQPAFAGLCGGGATPNADWAAERVLSLPMHPDLGEAEQDAVVAALAEAVRGAR